MKLLTFRVEGKDRLGVKTEQGILDVTVALQKLGQTEGQSGLDDVQSVIEGGEQAVAALQVLTNQALAAGDRSIFLDESELEFGPCLTRPQKIICIGLNYRKHAEETHSPIPVTPIVFNKFANALTGHGQDVPMPTVSEKVDYEAELAIVIGKKANNVGQAQALEFVFGYCPVNDVSARDLQMRTSQWLLGKSCDGFCPIGPYLVTADEVGNPNHLEIRAYVNGERRQNSNTSDMIFHCDELIAYLSRHMTLEPGDVILTGTPEGVAMGLPGEPYLKAGDTVTIEIEKLGSLTNRMSAQ